MCRLLGMIANQPVNVEFSLPKFGEKFGGVHHHGWGLAWYEDGEPRLYKTERSAHRDEARLAARALVDAPLFIAHVRWASLGTVTAANAHPFRFRNYIFAHNGTVDRDAIAKKLKPEFAEGLTLTGTDSEAYFRLLVQSIAAAGDTERGLRAGIDLVQKLSRGGMNFLLSDGNKLYAYRNGDTLFRLTREPKAAGPWRGVSRETGALLESKLARGEKAVLVCSEPLTADEEWVPFENNQLLALAAPK